MNDLIYRQVAIDDIRKEYGGIKNANIDGDFLVDEIEFILSKISPALKWIPVTERLPEKDGRYLCTYESDELISVNIGRVVDGEWTDWYAYPTAWMPLPKPYRKETENE